MTRAATIAMLGVWLPGCFVDPPAIEDTTTDSSTTGGPTATTESDGSTGPATTSTGADTTSESTTGDAPDPIVLGPLVPIADLDDGAIWAAQGSYTAAWWPSGENNEIGRSYLGQYPPGQQYFGYMRFRLPAEIPAAATIDSVELEISGHDTYEWDGHALRVWAQASADAPAVTGIADFPDDATLTEVSVRWPDDGGVVWMIPGPNATPDLSPILQSLVDTHGGLAAESHVQLWVGEDVLDGVGEEVGWLDSKGGIGSAPHLTIAFHR